MQAMLELDSHSDWHLKFQQCYVRYQNAQNETQQMLSFQQFSKIITYLQSLFMENAMRQQVSICTFQNECFRCHLYIRC